MKLTHNRGGGKGTSLHPTALAVAFVFVVLLAVFAAKSPYQAAAAHAAENKSCKKTAVSLQDGYIEAEKAFQKTCGKCHAPPDPSKPSCASDLPEEDLTTIWTYMYETRTLGSVALDCLESEKKATYEKHCVKCHELPDPAKTSCISDPPLEELLKAHSFMEGVRDGKDLYAKSCNSCHASIEPTKHDFDFWRRHLCAEAAGLETDEAQKVLLYLKATGKRQ